LPYANTGLYLQLSQKSLGKYALYVAFLSFVDSLAIASLRQYIPGGMEAGLLADPISAIYTPFQFTGLRGLFNDLLPAP
jgi:hypothetical protein